ERRLAVVNVRDDAKVADVTLIHGCGPAAGYPGDCRWPRLPFVGNARYMRRSRPSLGGAVPRTHSHYTSDGLCSPLHCVASAGITSSRNRSSVARLVVRTSTCDTPSAANSWSCRIASAGVGPIM